MGKSCIEVLVVSCFICLLPGIHAVTGGALQCDVVKASDRFDCHPGKDASQQSCIKRGCCWLPTKKLRQSVPYCFYPKDFPTYEMGSPKQTPFGYSVMLKRTTKTYYPRDVMQLQMDLYFETSYRLHFKIYDPRSKRYEVPIPTPKVSIRAPHTEYKVLFSKSPMGLVVSRAADGTVLFNSSVSTLIFADQFLQISTSLVTSNIYGLGEHRGRFRVSSDWETYPIWARDHPPQVGGNLYGVHPFYLNLEGASGRSHGVFLLNSNAMEVALQPTPALTYRTIGGILDFYIFLGPGAEQVVQQYNEVIGRPLMPPYWGLGFHLCRWGYGSSNRTMEIVKRMKSALIPQDTQWNDIEYAEGRKDFTLNTSTFGGLPDFIIYLHANNMHYVPIIDPAISSNQPAGSYPPYDSGIAQDVFVKDTNGKPLVGRVWPGVTVFPDFFSNQSKSWWFDQIKDFHGKILFDGIWIDMNEPSSFVDGSVNGCPATMYNEPPYTPAIIGGKLAAMTVCPSATHSIGRHYDLHNLYGYSESVATHDALIRLRKKRSFVISRSSYPGSGKYAGHWLGDNYSLWPDMAYSIAGIMTFNLFGIPLIGADICGFNLNTSEELCQRWMQLGAFYPFSRNHNTLGAKDQDPTAFSEAMQHSTRRALQLRYSILPYLYTLFHHAHISGSTVARPLFFDVYFGLVVLHTVDDSFVIRQQGQDMLLLLDHLNGLHSRIQFTMDQAKDGNIPFLDMEVPRFPTDSMLYDVDRQFMLGSALVVTPVLEEGATHVTGIFPKGRWFSIIHENHFDIDSTQEVTLPAPLDEINIHIRGGQIVPMQIDNSSTTTSEYRKLPFTLIVARSQDGSGTGSLYWDDGDSLDTYEQGNYLSLTFTSLDTSFQSTVAYNGYSGSHDMTVEKIVLLGVPSNVSSVAINGTKVQFLYNSTLQNIYISHLRVPMLYDFLVTWSWQTIIE